MTDPHEDEGVYGYRIAHDDGIRWWSWKLESGWRVGACFEWAWGDTIMVVAWLGWWAVRLGYDFPLTEASS